MSINKILDKLVIKAELTLVTGMHIGASNDFAPIGAVDSVVVRDPMTKLPIIPGSSLKGKLRTLLVKSDHNNGPVLEKIEKDSQEIKRLFGASAPEVISSRLQFYDLKLSNEAVIENKNLDLHLTEIKFENTINRLNGVANPRQIERVPAGAMFNLVLVYNLESEEEVEDDFATIAKAFKILQLDYIGGSGTRGYGKVALSHFSVEKKNFAATTIQTDSLQATLKEAENYALLSV